MTSFTKWNGCRPDREVRVEDPSLDPTGEVGVFPTDKGTPEPDTVCAVTLDTTPEPVPRPTEGVLGTRSGGPVSPGQRTRDGTSEKGTDRNQA